MNQLTQPNSHTFRTKAEIVYETLRLAIMRCELEPGTRLIIDDISHQLGVSHIPVREALNQLQSERLVDVRPHAGATVTPIDPQDIIEIFTIMEGLESVAMRVAAEQVSEEHLKEVRRLIAQMDASIEQNDPEKYAELNIDFHREIASLTQMPMLTEMTSRVLDRWDRARRHIKVLPGRMSESQAQHHDIVQAISSQNASKAEALATLHNRAALSAYRSSFDVLAGTEDRRFSEEAAL